MLKYILYVAAHGHNEIKGSWHRRNRARDFSYTKNLPGGAEKYKVPRSLNEYHLS